MFSYRKKFLLIYFIIVSLVGILIYNLFATLSQTNVNNISNNSLQNKANERIQYSKDFFEPYYITIKAISENKILKNYLTNQNNKTYIEEYFLSIKKSLPCALQVRYLDTNAQEIIKVGGVPLASKEFTPSSKIFPKKDLHNKSTRTYVQQFQKLNKDEIGTSNFNLNMEKGKIQLPKRPVARLGMKVYDNNGQERGLIILNICLRTFFANLDKTILYDVFLLDNKGKFLHHHDKRYGIIGDQNYTIFDMIPTLNNNILNEEIYLEKHLFITKLNLFNNTQDIRIVLKNKFIAQGEKTHEMQEKFVIAYIIFAIILLPLALYFSKRPDELTKDIKEKMDVISQNVIYSRTDKSGKIVDVSDAFCKLSGYSKEELIGSSHNIIRHPDSSKELFEDMWEKLLSFKAWRGEIKNKKKDGGYYWVFSDIQPKFNNKGEHIGYISVRSDITDRKNFEHQQLEMLEQSKMAAMGEMIGNIAHQWRQPLSVITTVASGVAFKQENNVLKIEDIPKDMDHIVQSAEYLSDTIETFRNFLKEKKERKDICIQDRVLEVLSILSATIKNYDLRIIDNISDTEPITINMVAGELEQVIINILNNSKDVFIEKEIDDRWIKLDLQKYEDKIVFTIEDNGGGIPEHILPKIFEAYFTTKHKSKGTGLGLNMSYRIVTESFNGKLYVNNTRNGAKFFIEIPFS